jgi:hypothetical protein
MCRQRSTLLLVLAAAVGTVFSMHYDGGVAADKGILGTLTVFATLNRHPAPPCSGANLDGTHSYILKSDGRVAQRRMLLVR